MRFHKKAGDYAAPGEPLCTIYYNDTRRFEEARWRLLEAYSFGGAPVEQPALIQKTIIGGA
jgi:thymidine phosphorylase